jgi:hypothetical protein
MISGLFDVYNLGTASALRVDGITIVKTGTQKIMPKLWHKMESFYLCSFCTNGKSKIANCND